MNSVIEAPSQIPIDVGQIKPKALDSQEQGLENIAADTGFDTLLQQEHTAHQSLSSHSSSVNMASVDVASMVQQGGIEAGSLTLTSSNLTLARVLELDQSHLPPMIDEVGEQVARWLKGVSEALNKPMLTSILPDGASSLMSALPTVAAKSTELIKAAESIKTSPLSAPLMIDRFQSDQASTQSHLIQSLADFSDDQTTHLLNPTKSSAVQIGNDDIQFNVSASHTALKNMIGKDVAKKADEPSLLATDPLNIKKPIENLSSKEIFNTLDKKIFFQSSNATVNNRLSDLPKQSAPSDIELLTSVSSCADSGSSSTKPMNIFNHFSSLSEYINNSVVNSGVVNSGVVNSSVLNNGALHNGGTLNHLISTSASQISQNNNLIHLMSLSGHAEIQSDIYVAWQDEQMGETSVRLKSESSLQAIEVSKKSVAQEVSRTAEEQRGHWAVIIKTQSSQWQEILSENTDALRQELEKNTNYSFSVDVQCESYSGGGSKTPELYSEHSADQANTDSELDDTLLSRNKLPKNNSLISFNV